MGVTVKSKSQQWIYQCVPGGLSVSVVAGDGNPGAIEVLLAGTQVAAGAEIDDLPLGSAPALVGQELTVLATLTDQNPVSAQTSATVRLTNAATNKTRRLSLSEASTQGDVVAFRFTINFV